MRFLSYFARSRQLLVSLSFLLLILIAIEPGLAQSPQKTRKVPPPPPPPAAVDQELVIPYWTTETGWSSELELRNNVAGQDLTVTPALRLPDGTETRLAPVTIKSQEVKSVDVAAAISKASEPQLIGTYGSAVLRYHSSSLKALYASVMIRAMGHAIAFHVDGSAEYEGMPVGSREGIWWLPKDTASDYLILTNQGKNALALDLSLYDANGRENQQKVLLGAHATNRVSVRNLLQAAGLAGSYGGIKISAASHAGSLDTLHFLFDTGANFSAILKMFDHDPNAQLAERDFAGTKVWTLRAPMLALSNPDPALVFPPGTVLRPQIFIRNATAKPIDAALRFNWRTGSTTGKAAGPQLHLLPYETRLVDVGALQDGTVLPQQANWTSVTLTSNAMPDELMAVAASYDQTLKYGAQTPFSDQLSHEWKGGMWEFDPNHDSIITAGNGGTQPTQAAFTIFYNQGTQRYELEQTLQPDEQMWMDVGKLIQLAVPDKNGKVLPRDLASGSYEFRDLTHTGLGTLFEGKVIYDKTYGHATYGCAVCCGYNSALLFYDPIDLWLPVPGNDGVWGNNPCDMQYDDVSSSFYGNWTSLATSVVAVDYYGKHTPQGLGSTTTKTYAYLESNAHYPICPAVYRAPGGGANVFPAFIVGYNSYIPVDNVQGPSTCNFAGAQIQKIYMGDANRGTYRTAEQIQIIPDLQQSTGFFQDTGQTRNYGAYSPKNGSTLSGLDEDGIANDCYLWNAAGKAIPAFSYDVSYPYAHQGQVHFSGSGANPLESQSATITWDMRVVLDTTNQQSPTAYVNYNHTCYPSHQIKVNGQVIYLYTPPENDIGYITGCLFFHTGKITGQTNPVPVPSQ